jgi:hypothetical protein
MSKNVRIIDFQVSAGSTGNMDEERAINVELFSTYEPVRLWLKDHVIKAPFRKVVVSFENQAWSTPWHGHMTNAFGICEVTESVDIAVLRQNAGDHRWVIRGVEHALSCIENALGWRSEELEGFLAAMSEKPLPLIHFFDLLTRIDKISGMKCVPWLSTRPGKTEMGVRLVAKDNTERDVVLRSTADLLLLEYTFPLAKSAIRGTEFMLLDKTGKVLASVPLDKSGLT